MPVVSDSSPVMNLAIIGQLDLLRDQFCEVWIPPGVLEELRVQEELPGCKAIRDALKQGWLRVHDLLNQAMAQSLRREIDKGEAEAIALAIQVGAETLLLDERRARRVAKPLGLKVTGVLGVLSRAFQAGKLGSIRQSMEDLRRKAAFRIAPALFDQVLRQCGTNHGGPDQLP